MSQSNESNPPNLAQPNARRRGGCGWPAAPPSPPRR